MNKNDLSKIATGRLGYNIAEKYLLLNNFDIYTPVLENTKIDCIVSKNNKLAKIQIKTIQHNKSGKRFEHILPVRKLSNNRGTNKQKLYTMDEVDFFIGVDLISGLLYIIPITFIAQYTSAISIKALAKFENNFTLLDEFLK